MGPAPARRRPLISLTPLIDVVFILLVFFMLASSFLDWRAIGLETSERAIAATSVEAALLVEVRPDGLRFAGAPIALGELAERLGERAATRPQRRVLVKSAKGVGLQAVVDVLDRLAAAGVHGVSLVGDSGL